jgi:class 3 adenylate cyclase
MLASLVQSRGYEPIQLFEGARVADAVRERPPDLILLDLMMPELNGYQVLGHLKADGRWREIPVIMISGLRETDSVVRCIEAGADDYLPKPFDPVLLRARISACLERKRWHDRERQYLAELAAEKARADALLHNILPRDIVLRLGNGEVLIADRVEEATILFCDLVGFTELAAALPPARLIERLNGVFSEFDLLARELGIEKIKTIGDAYMAAAGLPLPREDHAAVMAELALGMLEALKRQNATARRPFRARIGMHTGPVVAGIIGRHKFIYDVWGDTVNLASRLEAQGVPGRIQVSAATREALAHRYAFEPRGPVQVRGKGQVPAYLLLGRHPAA